MNTISIHNKTTSQQEKWDKAVITLDLIVLNNSSLKIQFLKPTEFISKKEQVSNYWCEYFFQYLLIRQQHCIELFVTTNNASQKEQIDRPTVINQRKELCKFLLGLHEHNQQLIEDVSLREQVLLNVVTRANMFRLNVDDSERVIYEYFINSQRAYERLAFDTIQNKFEPNVFWVTDNDYNQIEHFGWVYGNEALELRKILVEKPSQRISVLDDATGFGHFIFTCLYLLEPALLDRVDFIATDYKNKDMAFAIEESKKYSFLHSKWLIEDINNENHFNHLRQLNQGELYDLIVVNHVIEHLNNKPLVEYLHQWLQLTQTLIVSVPFEDSLDNSVSSHFHLFDETILTDLGYELKKTMKKYIHIETPYIKGGLLVIRRGK